MVTLDIFEQLFKKRVGLIKPGLTRILDAYRLLGQPTLTVPSVIIGGTNGKGGTSGSLSMLLGMSLRSGLYTSPHLREFRERFILSDKEITDQELITALDHLKGALPPALYQEISFFEVATLLAFEIFATHQSDFNIFEVGLGGRLDATNIVNPLASVIVSIGLDHQQYLGDTVASILHEKLGIIRAGRPLFTGDFLSITNDTEASSLLLNRVAELKIPLWQLGCHFGRDGFEITIELPNLPRLQASLPALLHHAPGYLLDNFTLACAVYHWLRESAQPAITKPLLPLRDVLAKFDSSAASIKTPPSLVGRFLRLNIDLHGKQQPFLFDVCHNVDGAQRFLEGILNLSDSWGRGRVPGLVSILRDKNFDEMIDIFKGIFDPLVIFRIDNERSLQPGDLDRRHNELPMFNCFEDALNHLKSLAQGGTRRHGVMDTPWIVCGSVLAVGKVLEYFEIKPLDLHIDRVIRGDWPTV